MNRRCAIRQLVTLTGGVLLLHSCMEDRSKGSFLLKNYSLSADQENLLAMLAETVIPKTSTPGGKDIYAHHFVMKMVDDCTSTADRERFLRGLEAFAENARSMNGTSFHQTAIYGREKVVRALQERKEEEESDEKFFFKRMKNLTIRAYTSSKFYLTDVQPYELVPSRWSGCVAVS
jgi:hypothetical protein